MQCAPVERAVEGRPFVFRNARRLLNVGSKARVRIVEDRLELAPDLVGRGLQRVQPREVLAVEEFVGWKERIVQPVTLVRVDRPAAEQCVGRRAYSASAMTLSTAC